VTIRTHTPSDLSSATQSQFPAHIIEFESRWIVGTRVDAGNYESTIDLICEWARQSTSCYVCISTVHMIMEGYDDPEYQEIVNRADRVTSDGMPLVWGLRALGATSAERVYGPTLTPKLCARAAEEGISVGFYGSTPETLQQMTSKLKRDYPSLNIPYQHSPPFRQLEPEEVEQEIQEITDSGVRILFVGLGCPKQEQWMASRVGHIPAVMIGVGAAFDYVAGTKAQAPGTVQKLGLEWLFRMVTEPRRLWRRYLYNNPRFVLLFGAQLLRSRFNRKGTN
jgi:N-acetylglucosaminyldiphosphoundecaprenol N-acetyl-beta-D-mannosaminyltransferase